MDLFGADTRPEVARILIEGYRKMTPAQKLEIVEDLSRTARRLAEAGVRERHPGANEREVALRLAALTMGRAVTMRAFGWDPEREGW